MPSFPFNRQLDAMDCGPACLQMISRFYGKTLSLQTLRDLSYMTRQGVSLLGISDAAESVGYRTMGVRLTTDQLLTEAPLPCIAHWNQKHFIVVYRVKKDKVYVADPAFGLAVYTKEIFLKSWLSTRIEGESQGHCLLLAPTNAFYETPGDSKRPVGFLSLLGYLRGYKKLIWQLALGLLFGSIIQLVFPFLTQSLVDIGINNQDIGFVYLILLAQLFLFISRISVDFIRRWILLHIGTRINVNLVSDFLGKLMNLPQSFFETKMMGDFMQRVADQKKIENFLTSTSLSILFSFFNIVLFGFVLLFYNWKILLVFLIGSALYIVWINFFMVRRRALDYHMFALNSRNQTNLVEIFSGMHEIKLNNCEKQKRWEWESIQADLFAIKMKMLKLDQYQEAGATTINELKNILVTVLSATFVIKGQMTLGMMLAVSYILGQLNGPLAQMIDFFHSTQDARISLERLNDIHEKPDEVSESMDIWHDVPQVAPIHLKNVSFRYEGPHSPTVLQDINLEIPENKVTAIVGVSGSGKTTLIKLLLGFYAPVSGEIKLGEQSLQHIHPRKWRAQCGVVMQDGYLFSDTIARNIALSADEINQDKLREVIHLTNLQEFLNSLPMGLNTKIGMNGQGISEGQKQRILIARALYKDPKYLFLDEATNALDAANEKTILENLASYMENRTAVVVAHRLSTVKNAAKIVVLSHGIIMETGTHDELLKLNGIYFGLIKNQLELGV